ncbi:MAG: DUF4623 domain-containing protein [Bacteroidia bacterium]|nr:DUF4623 domain-containing protein [Bacteroidia bacterium]
MHKLIKNIGLVALALGGLFSSCGDNYPKSEIAPYATELLEVKIVNAGRDGSLIVTGTIDEENKIINFPRLDVETNFSALEIEAKMSEGAELQQSVLDFSMAEDEAFKTLILRVVNNKRYKDYFIKVRKNIPVFGADFEKPTVYDFSGDKIYPDFTSLLTRSASFDGQQVLIVARSATKPHLLNVSDLKKGEIKPISLDMTDVSGGTYPYNQGALANGHVYMASLSGSKASPLKIYYWETPTSKPEVVANINVGSIPNVGNRHGDNLSLSLDKHGNGFIFFGDNASTEILRFTVTNHKTISDPIVLPSNSNATSFMNINRIEETSQFVWSGVRTGIMLTDELANVKYTVNPSYTAVEAIDPRVFTFNKERYLMVCTAGLGSATKATPAIYVYNITKGNTVEESLKLFNDGENHHPDYTFILGGSGNAAPSAQTGYAIEKDEKGNDVKLLLFGARADSGFVICEFPIKLQDEE